MIGTKMCEDRSAGEREGVRKGNGVPCSYWGDVGKGGGNDLLLILSRVQTADYIISRGPTLYYFTTSLCAGHFSLFFTCTHTHTFLHFDWFTWEHSLRNSSTTSRFSSRKMKHFTPKFTNHNPSKALRGLPSGSGSPTCVADATIITLRGKKLGPPVRLLTLCSIFPLPPFTHTHSVNTVCSNSSSG